MEPPVPEPPPVFSDPSAGSESELQPAKSARQREAASDSAMGRSVMAR